MATVCRLVCLTTQYLRLKLLCLATDDSKNHHYRLLMADNPAIRLPSGHVLRHPDQKWAIDEMVG